MQTPSVGRIVHYHGHLTPDVPTAAIVAAVLTDTGDVNLCRILPDGLTCAELGIPFSETPQAGHWSWPPTVAPSAVPHCTDEEIANGTCKP